MKRFGEIGDCREAVAGVREVPAGLLGESVDEGSLSCQYFTILARVSRPLPGVVLGCAMIATGRRSAHGCSPVSILARTKSS